MRRISPPRFIRRESPKRSRYGSPVKIRSPHRNGRSSMDLWNENTTSIPSSRHMRQRSRSRDRRRDLRDKIRIEDGDRHSTRSSRRGGEREDIHKRLNRSADRYDEGKEKRSIYNHRHGSRDRHPNDDTFDRHLLDRDFEELREEPILDPSSINFYTNIPPQEDAKHNKYVDSYIKEDSAKNENERINRLEKLVEKLVEGNAKVGSGVAAPFVDDTPIYSKISKGVPELIPSNSEFTVSMWLNKIHDECAKRLLSEKNAIHFLEDRMTGVVKSWYKTVMNFKYTWSELRMVIIKMFPDNTDFVTTLKLLVSRDKTQEETFSQYYFSKLYLCEACRITGKNAVACIIDGLNNQFLKQDIKLYKFQTPEALYSEYLIKYTDTNDFVMKSNNDNNMWIDTQTPSAFHANDVILVDDDGGAYAGKPSLLPSPRTLEPIVKISSRQSSSRARCTTCRKKGHSTLECRHAPLCYNCSKRGHIAVNCPNMLFITASTDNQPSRQQQHHHHHHHNHHRRQRRRRERRERPFNQLPCKINGKNCKGIIDTGSLKTIVSDRLIEDLPNLSMQPSRMVFHGIGRGSRVRATGIVHLNLTIGLALEIQHDVYVVRNDDIPVDLIVGQDFIQRDGIAAVFANGKVDIINTNSNTTH